MTEPRAKQLDHVHHRPTGDVADPFQWLADRDDPDTNAYLETENRYAEEWFGQDVPLLDELFEEIKSRRPGDRHLGSRARRRLVVRIAHD